MIQRRLRRGGHRIGGYDARRRNPIGSVGREIFAFWSLLKTFFTKRHMPKRLLKIDHFLGVLEHEAKV